MEIVPPSEHSKGYKIEFFDDEVERIRTFDIGTGKPLADIMFANIFAATHFVTPKAKLEEAILDGADIRKDEVLEKHADWVDEFLPKYESINADNIDDILQKEIGKVFMHVLEDAGVYKRNPEGQAAFDRFIKTI